MTALVLALTYGCSSAQEAPAGPPSGTGLPPYVMLGRNWYPLETYGGERFRWARNDAEIVLLDPPTSLTRLALTLEAGPGLGRTEFDLHVRYHGHDVAIRHVEGRGRIVIGLSVPRGEDRTFALHVDDAGRIVGNDRRILNFRVFSIEEQ